MSRTGKHLLPTDVVLCCTVLCTEISSRVCVPTSNDTGTLLYNFTAVLAPQASRLVLSSPVKGTRDKTRRRVTALVFGRVGAGDLSGHLSALASRPPFAMAQRPPSSVIPLSHPIPSHPALYNTCLALPACSYLSIASGITHPGRGKSPPRARNHHTSTYHTAILGPHLDLDVHANDGAVLTRLHDAPVVYLEIVAHHNILQVRRGLENKPVLVVQAAAARGAATGTDGGRGGRKQIWLVWSACLRGKGRWV